MSQVIRWGILGTGKIAGKFAEGLSQLPDAKLVAVASRSASSAEAFGGKHGATTFHASYAALANDPDVDVIYIATPHPMHAENALLCLSAGKHVLCEKPFTMNRREAAKVVELARQKKVFLMEAMWSRFLPILVEAKRIVDSGEIGVVQKIDSDLSFTANFGPEHRLYDPALGGGALLDLGIYPLSLSSFFLGPVTAVQAMGELGDTGVDEQTAFLLQHQGGGMSTCACSLRVDPPCEMVITGTLGHIRLHGRFHETTSLTVTLANGRTRNEQKSPIGNGYAHEAVEVMRCLRAGLIESPVMPLDETLALMGILDTIRSQIGLSYAADTVL
jgi:predicted dehydrogenase